jgi:lysophospholipase L1-like esterase
MPSRLRLVIKRITPGASFALLLISQFPATGFSQAVAPAAKAADKPASERWEKDILAFEEADKMSPPPKGAILFVGASSIRRWTTLPQDFPDLKVINRGFGGSQMADSVYFADRIVIPYKPRLIVINAGGNDINAGKTPKQVLADFRAFVEKVRAALPGTRIAFVSLSPSPKRWEQVEEQKEANRLVKEYVRSGKDLDYIELWDQFLGPDGRPREDLFVEDRLHNNEAGYKIRAEVVRPHLR